jgi:hypothetical protein
MGGLIEWLSGTHTCECGAVYRVRVTRSPFPDTDTANCDVCGKEMDRWRNSTSFRSYELVTKSEGR